MRIHYNATGADRKALVKVIAEATGAKAEYKGMPSAAYEIDCFTVTKDGVLEFSDRTDTEEVEAVLEALAAAGLNGVGETAEVPEDAQESPTLADTAPERPAAEPNAENDAEPQESPTSGDTAPEGPTAEPNAENNPEPQDSPTSGDTTPQEAEGSTKGFEEHDPIELTVTIPLARHTGMSLRNLINLIYAKAPLLNKALGTEFRVDEGLVRLLQNDGCVLSVDRLFQTVEDYENRHGIAGNGLGIEPDKITFSTLPETEDPALMRTFTTLCAMMNRQALTQQRIQAREAKTDNEKFAMRCWLMRLGMNGPEYKAERSILMKNLSGHSAFRTEKDRERWQAKQREKRDARKALRPDAQVTIDASEEG